jgi:hypothetical protein
VGRTWTKWDNPARIGTCRIIGKALAALATSWCSFGGTIAAFIADALVEGGIVAEKISAKIAKVIAKLDKLAGDAGKSAKSLESLSKALKKFKGKADDLSARSLDKASAMEGKAADLHAKADATKASYAAMNPEHSAARNRADEWHRKSGDAIGGNLGAKFDRLTGNGASEYKLLSDQKSTFDKATNSREKYQEKSVLDAGKWKDSVSSARRDVMGLAAV